MQGTHLGLCVCAESEVKNKERKRFHPIHKTQKLTGVLTERQRVRNMREQLPYGYISQTRNAPLAPLVDEGFAFCAYKYHRARYPQTGQRQQAAPVRQSPDRPTATRTLRLLDHSRNLPPL